MPFIILVAFGFFLTSCYMPPPPLPQQELPRQTLPAPEARAEAPTRASALTPGMIGKNIQKGKTTQAEVMEIFGPPDMVTRSGSGEMWGYDKVSREVAEQVTGSRSTASVGASSAAGSRIGGGGGGLVGGAGGGVLGGVVGLLGGSAGQAAAQNQQQASQQNQQQARRTESTTTVFLLVYYDDKGVVTDYRLSATKF
jgi:hypothetical protein